MFMISDWEKENKYKKPNTQMKPTLYLTLSLWKTDCKYCFTESHRKII